MSDDLMKDLPVKPVLFADTRTDAEKFDPNLHRGHLDPSRIPGYSEIVQANDIAKADDLIFRKQNEGQTKEDLYRQLGAMPAPLPVEFAWLPISGTAGGESSHVVRQLDKYTSQEGFRLAEQEDLDRYGYGFPPTGRKAEDGTIRRGPDVALYVRSGVVAKMWDTFKQDQQSSLEGNREAVFSANGYEANFSAGEQDRETVTVKH